MKNRLREIGEPDRKPAARKVTNLALDADVLKQAERWRAANREAVDNYNARIARDGAFGDSFRCF